MTAELVTCADCGAKVSLDTTEIVPHGTGLRCHHCAHGAVVADHEQRHRGRRGLLFPMLFGVLGGAQIGLHEGGNSTTLAVIACAIGGAVVAVALRLGYLAASERVTSKPGRALLVGLILGGAVTAVFWPLGSEGALTFGVIVAVVFGVCLSVDSAESTLMEAPKGMPSENKALVMVGVATVRHWDEALMMITGGAILVASVIGVAYGVEAAGKRSKRGANEDRVNARLAARSAGDTAPTEAFLPCPDTFPSSCPKGTTATTKKSVSPPGIEEGCASKSGRLHGPFTWRFPTGEVRRQGAFCNGKKRGLWVVNEKSGRKTQQGSFRDDRRVGRWTYFGTRPELARWTQFTKNGKEMDSGWVIARAEVLGKYKLACGQRNGEACANAAKMYDSGDHVAEDRKKALALYRKGCKAAHGGACFEAGRILIEADGVKENSKQAARHLRESCVLGFGDGCLQVGLLETERGRDVRAGAAYWKACQAGTGQGCFTVTQLRKSGVKVRGAPDDAELMRQACAGHYRPACGK